MPNGGVDLHGEHPRPLPKRAAYPLAGVLLRPRQHIADAPVACFVTALHNHLSKADAVTIAVIEEGVPNQLKARKDRAAIAAAIASAWPNNQIGADHQAQARQADGVRSGRDRPFRSPIFLHRVDVIATASTPNFNAD